jgi:hypothetical protein
MIPTVHTLRSARRRLAKRVGRIEQADAVLAEMQAGASFHLQFTRSGPLWVLSSGRQVPDVIARLVIASASVVGVGDALFDGCPAQTFRWWREHPRSQNTEKAP